MVIEHAELERAGLVGGGWLVLGEAAFALAAWLVLTGDAAWAGVGKDDAPALTGREAGIGAVYCCPNSPGANDNVEQKPSEELMISVKPSFDLNKVSPKLT